MSEQTRIAFEKWFDKQLDNENAFTSDEPICKQAWIAAKADSEREIEELRDHINILHKFIYWECDVYLNGLNPEFSKKYRELLTSTPAQIQGEIK